MYSEFDQISLLSMSNSELLLAEKDLKSIEFKLLLRPTFEFPDGCRIAILNDREVHRQDEEVKVKEDEEETCHIAVLSEEVKMPSLGEFKVDDNDDGFRTPTSLDHKIPVIQKCPPAPRKLRSLPSIKRKASSSHRRCRMDLTEDFESLFHQALLADHSHKIKKVRGDYTK